jgi:hypothetical protein
VRENCDRLAFKIPGLIEGEAVGRFAMVVLLAVVTGRFVLAAAFAILTILTAAHLF